MVHTMINTISQNYPNSAYREAMLPLVMGVLRAVYYRVPSAGVGWIRYGNALQVGHVEVISP
jgi:hypothetical protein